MNGDLPGFYRAINALISEIAREKGRDPEEFKQSLLQRIRDEQGNKGRSRQVPSPYLASTRRATSQGEAANDKL